MNRQDETKQILINHFYTYPKLKPFDLFKFIYQSSFGCEHMISDIDTVTERIKKESEAVSDSVCRLTEQLDGNYSRVSLEYLKLGLSPETLGKLFFLSSKKEPKGETLLKEKLDILTEIITKSLLPLNKDEYNASLKKWENDGFSPVHHSDYFKGEYKPSYRVISNKYAKFLPLFAEIDKRLSKGNVRLAIEGGSASGKSTLSEILNDVYGCTVLHMDDFFLRPEQRTKERFKEIGGNIDKERFLEEILPSLANNSSISYRRFDCSTFKVLPPETVIPQKLTVIEGVYSMNPAFSDYYNLSAFLDISHTTQKKRIEKRNSPELAKRFFNEWIPLENRYFEETNTKNKCDIIIEIKE